MAIQGQTRHGEEGTFRNYTPAQAKAYVAGRSAYNDKLYSVIFGHHASTGGRFGTLMDVGCGPGNATRPLAKPFNTAYGTDPSLEMIRTAKKLSMESPEGETASGKKINFMVAKAEDAGNPEWDVGEKLDLLTAGMAVGAMISERKGRD